jgi:O-succinylbenzoic acid--CoA ligase
VTLSILRDDGSMAAVDEIGRIHVSGPMLMRGYKGQPPLTNGFETGDLGSLDASGNIHVASRRTDLIVTGGENVYPAEVEQVLLEVPGVQAALVFGLPDDRWGQIVSAALVRVPGVDERSLQTGIEQRLASHKRPRRICFVTTSPVTTAGKPDRSGAAKALEPQLRPWPPRD